MATTDNREEVFDLESSSQIELGRRPVCDDESQMIDPAEPPEIRTPHHRQSRSGNREFGLNQFPTE